ncbi:hypothetical protein CU103_29810 [Phyllobacterium sophorae]|uniref:HTH crp-type domain-containing protein n=2 Tax=Phyllobacterium sophorae TaxID=1520277 RepID=A0A2P7AQ91_9HYPH|nr:hypothetical protein CU103_29810 [Phyllobacterium sophorae]
MRLKAPTCRLRKWFDRDGFGIRDCRKNSGTAGPDHNCRCRRHDRDECCTWRVANVSHNLRGDAATGLTMPSSALRDALLRSETLRGYLLLYVQAFHAQAASAGLASQYQVGARLARQLLMIHDRIDGQLGLTHETLSATLGTRRPYLTETLNRFEETRLISTRRGAISILSRAGLIKLADGSYGSAELEYRRLLLK